MGCCNFICENYKVDGKEIVLSTIINVFFNNKRKISTAPVTDNQFHNILRDFDVLPNFPVTTRETMCDYYL